MNSANTRTLLATDDPSPVRVVNPAGRSSFLLIGDHAGNVVPRALGTLGLDDAELARHIGWDIGIGTLGPLLAEQLDAVFIRQTYSRLVVDCNRGPDAPDAVAEISDGTVVPGNAGLSADDRAARFAEIHTPYQQAIAAELARRDAEGRETILVALHSFTPEMLGFARPWQVGVLYFGGDIRYAQAVLAAFRARGDLNVGDNEPYQMDGTDYTVPRHAYPARPYAELEIRQDLLATPDGCADWAEILAEVLPAAGADFG
jgi:predicted N-formylglutamate amidohydrolase